MHFYLIANNMHVSESITFISHLSIIYFHNKYSKTYAEVYFFTWDSKAAR